MKVLTGLIFCCAAGLLFGQHSVKVYVNPFIQKFGNLNKQFIEKEHYNIEVNYFNKPSIELGSDYQRMYDSRWGWSAGASWKKDFYQLYYRSVRFYPGGTYENGSYRFISVLFYDRSVDNVGISVGVHRDLTESIRLNCLVHQYFRFGADPRVIYDETPSLPQADPPYGISEKIYEKAYNHPVTVPELSISVRVFQGFKLSIGSRFKFWSFEDYLAVDVYGSFESAAYLQDETKILHKSRINSKDISYFFGISYDVPFQRNKN